mgnify:FL=1
MSNNVVNAYRFGSLLPLSDDDLKCYWKFSELSGTIYEASESSVALGTSADISMTGGTYDVTGTPSDIGNAVLFDGTDDYGVSGSSLTQFSFGYSTDALWSLAFWLKVKSLSANEFFMNTSYTEGPSPVDDAVGNIWARFENTNRMLFHIARGVDNTRVLSFQTSDNYVPDFTNWYFYCASFDYNASSPQFSLKRDNANEETATKTGSGAVSPSTSASFPLNWGRRDASPAYYGNFEVCEVSLWNKIVSDDDQTLLYNGGNGREIY